MSESTTSKRPENQNPKKVKDLKKVLADLLAGLPVSRGEGGELLETEVFMPDQGKAISAQGILARIGYKDIGMKKIVNGWLITAKAVPAKGGVGGVRTDAQGRMAVTEEEGEKERGAGDPVTRKKRGGEARAAIE